MKHDRLYALTLYLLNHGRTSARELAERFEVSIRTIQRDIDALGRAGIPVESLPGKCGGYALVEGFRMERQLLTPEDRANLRAAMAGLASATGDPSAGAGLEKLMAVSPETSCQGLFNQIHRKATKKVPGSTFMLLTLRQVGHLRPLNSSSQRHAYSGNWSI